MNNGLHPDSNILMFFGGMKTVASLKKGDIIIGDDNNPHIVMNTITGEDVLYSIGHGDDQFICSAKYILPLYDEQQGKIIECRVEDIVDIARYNLYSVPIEYEEQSVKNDPHLIGMLLGSVVNNGAAKKEDIVKKYLSNKLDKIENRIKGVSMEMFDLSAIDQDELNYIINHIYIPDEYLYNTRVVRHKLLRGLAEMLKNKPFEVEAKSKAARNTTTRTSILAHTSKIILPRGRQSTSSRGLSVRSNSQGRSHSATRSTNKRPVSSRKILADQVRKPGHILYVDNNILFEQIKFLSKSLGYMCTPIDTMTLKIEGDLTRIPDLSTKLLYKLKIEKISQGIYRGVVLDPLSNGRLVLSNCIVNAGRSKD